MFLIGADEFGDFPCWKEPEVVFQLARLAVAERPGHAVNDAPAGVTFFEIELPRSAPRKSGDVLPRATVAGLVSAAVAAEIERLGLYRG